MKKVIFLILALALLLTLAGCRGMDDGYVTDSPNVNGSGTTGTNGTNGTNGNYNGTDDNGVVGGSDNNTGSSNSGSGTDNGSIIGNDAGDLTRRNDFVNDSLTGGGSAGAYSGNGGVR